MDIVNVILTLAQQLGVTLGVGAETVVLTAYVLAIRDRVIDKEEERFAHTAKRILLVGLALIIVSGIAIMAIEWVHGRQEVVLEPVYLFKILLIGIVLFLAAVVRGSTLSQRVTQGLIGATWYGLFMIHVLAPVALWSQLLILYVIWVIGFMLCWTGVVYLLKDRKIIQKVLVSETKTAPSTRVSTILSPAPRVPSPMTVPIHDTPNIEVVARAESQSGGVSFLQQVPSFFFRLFTKHTPRDQKTDDAHMLLIIPNQKVHETVSAVHSSTPTAIKNTKTMSSDAPTPDTLPTRQTTYSPTPVHAPIKKEIPLYPTPTASEPFVPPILPPAGVTKTVETHDIEKNHESGASEYLPAIRIMPKTKEDIDKQTRPTLVDVAQTL